MNDVDVDALPTLLDELRRELSAAVDELERSRAAHRQAESLLLAVLDRAPVPLVVVDAEQRVRVASAAAERAWGVQLGATFSCFDGIDERVSDMCREASEVGHVAADAMPSGFGASVLDEPGTGARYVIVWSERGDGATG